MKNKYRFKHRGFYHKADWFDKLLKRLIKHGFMIECEDLSPYRPMKTEISEEEIHKVEESIRRASCNVFNVEYSKKSLEKIYGIKSRDIS